VDLYRERAHLLAYLSAEYVSRMAVNDSDAPGWTVLYIHTPQGQMAWHIHSDDLDLFDHVLYAELEDTLVQWDGHDTIEKYKRLHSLIEDRNQ